MFSFFIIFSIKSLVPFNHGSGSASNFYFKNLKNEKELSQCNAPI